MRHLSYTSNYPLGLWQKIVAITAAAAMSVLVLMFSAVLLMVILIVGAVAFVYLWWKTRELRKQMKNFPPRRASMMREEFEGEVIEGEVICTDRAGNGIRT